MGGIYGREGSVRKAVVMARCCVDFVHNQFEFSEGDEVPDDHPMVALAPHLFDPIVDKTFLPPDPSKARTKKTS